MKWRTWAQPRLRPAAAGLKGRDAHPPDRRRRPDAAARTRGDRIASARQGCPAPPGADGSSTREIRLAVAAACARTWAPAAAAPSGRIACAHAANQDAAHPDGFARSPEVCAQQTAFHWPARAGLAQCDRHLWPRRRSDSAIRESLGELPCSNRGISWDAERDLARAHHARPVCQGVQSAPCDTIRALLEKWEAAQPAVQGAPKTGAR